MITTDREHFDVINNKQIWLVSALQHTVHHNHRDHISNQRESM